MANPSRIRSLLRQLLHLDEAPKRTALAFAIGVFITFSPPYGLHTIMVLACAWAFRFNLVALFAGACINTPWTLIPVLGFSLWLGCVLTGTPFPTSLEWSDTSAMGILHAVTPYAVPFVIGSTILSIVTALAAYPIALWVLVRFRSRRTHGDSDPLPRSRDIG